MPDDPPVQKAGGAEESDLALEIEPAQLGNLSGNTGGLQLIDIRDPWEVEVVVLPGAVTIPMTALPQQIDRLDASRRVVLICHHGMRSAHAAVWLRQQGFKDAVSVRGGIDAYAREIDSKLPTY